MKEKTSYFQSNICRFSGEEADDMRREEKMGKRKTNRVQIGSGRISGGDFQPSSIQLCDWGGGSGKRGTASTKAETEGNRALLTLFPTPKTGRGRGAKHTGERFKRLTTLREATGERFHPNPLADPPGKHP